MKKLFTLITIVALIQLSSPTNASAQVFGSLWSSGLNYACSLPAVDSITFSIASNCNSTIGKVYVNYGDGTDTTVYVQDCPGNYFYTLYHTFTTSGMFVPYIIETDTSANQSDTLLGSYYALAYLMSNNCTAVSGNFYIDNNHNCTMDAGERMHGAGWYAWANFNLQGTLYGLSGICDSTGQYSVQIPQGYTYAITPYYYADSTSSSPVFIPYASCPDTNSYSISVGTTAISNINFGYACDTSSLIDANSSVWSPNFRPGHKRHVYVYAGSTPKLCDSVDATVTLTLDAKLTIDSILYSYYPYTVSGNTITWTVFALNGLNNFINDIWVTCDSNAVLGDTVCNTVSVTATNYTDTNLSNNSFTYCTLVSNSFDPNEKIVLPQGKGPQGYIPDNTTLNYTINFQNTGNDTAYNVVIQDTLDANVDTSSIQLLEYSAAASMTQKGRVVTFTFSNIMLPDSNRNEAASQGFVMYSALPRKNLPQNTQLKNKAYIYFDNNAPVLTNTTLNTVQWPTGIVPVPQQKNDIVIYPNPASDQIFVRSANTSGLDAVLLDITGRVLKTEHAADKTTSISVATLPTGIYIVKVICTGGATQTFKVNIQH